MWFFNIKKNKNVIGRREHVSLPEFDINNVVAKIDTGAFRSVIHSSNVREETSSSGPILVFTLLDDIDREHRTGKFSKVKVISSNGDEQIRYQFNTVVVINGIRISADFSLFDRSKMTYPILIGRQAISNNFLVDVDMVR